MTKLLNCIPKIRVRFYGRKKNNHHLREANNIDGKFAFERD